MNCDKAGSSESWSSMELEIWVPARALERVG